MMTFRRPKEQAQRLGINVQLIYAAIRRGQLRAARIGAGRNYLVPDEWVEAWLIAQAPPAPEAGTRAPRSHWPPKTA